MAQTKTQLIQNFVTTLSTDCHYYTELLKLLQQQQSLYLTFDSDKLNDNLHAQQPILSHLQHNAAQRHQSLKLLGLPNNEQGAQKLLSVLPAKIRQPATAQWQRLHALIAKCQQCNQENGQNTAMFQELLERIIQPNQHTYGESVG